MVAASHGKSLPCLQSWTKYLEQSKEIKEIGRGAENFLCIIFNYYYKSPIFGRKAGSRIYLPPIIIIIS